MVNHPKFFGDFKKTHLLLTPAGNLLVWSDLTFGSLLHGRTRILHL